MVEVIISPWSLAQPSTPSSPRGLGMGLRPSNPALVFAGQIPECCHHPAVSHQYTEDTHHSRIQTS